MSGPMDLDRRIDAFLGDGPNRAPGHLLGQTLRAAAATRQVRRPWWPWQWRLGRGPRRDFAFALAGAGLALVLGGLFLRSGLLSTPGPTDSAVPGATPSATASPRLSPSPSPVLTADPLVFTSTELGFSARFVDAAHHAVRSARVPVNGVLFPVGSVSLDVYQYSIIVSAGDPQLGVELIDDGAFITATTLDGLEAEFRKHVPGASAGETVQVDGEPARLLSTVQDGRGGAFGAPSPGPTPVPEILIVHEGRPYVISWRDGFLPGQIDRRVALLAFVDGFHFLPGVPTPTPGQQPSPSGRIDVLGLPLTIDLTGWYINSGVSAAVGQAVLSLENPGLAAATRSSKFPVVGLAAWLRLSAYVHLTPVEAVDGATATLASAAATEIIAWQADGRLEGTITTEAVTLPAGSAKRLTFVSRVADDLGAEYRMARVIYLIDAGGTLIRFGGVWDVDANTDISPRFLELVRTIALR